MRVCILSLSRIPDDPRVRRQGDALVEAGHEVTAVGLDGGLCDPPEWLTGVADERSTRLRRLGTAFRGVVGRLGHRAALLGYWTSRLHRRMYRAAKGARPADLVIANDWRVLPIAARLSRQWNARIHYDSHEYAIEERADSKAWRLLIAPWVRQIEGGFIREADTISTVADGIADAMQTFYSLRERPAVIRNTPSFETVPRVQCHDPIRVLFHGGLLPNRGLEALLRSVPQWKADRVLFIRGPAEPAYRRSLEALIRDEKIGHRVTLAEAAPMLDLVRLANEHDVGVFTPALVSEQMRFALPNKLFEYLMAGLCVVATDLPEIRRLLERHGAGIVVDPSPEAIAAAINELCAEQVEIHKAHALVAARELCWDREKSKLLDVLEDR